MSIGASHRVGGTALVISLAQGCLPCSIFSAAAGTPPQPNAASTSNIIVFCQSMHCNHAQLCFQPPLVRNKATAPGLHIMGMPQKSSHKCTIEEALCQEALTRVHVRQTDGCCQNLRLTGLSHAAAAAGARRAVTRPSSIDG